MYIVYGGVRRDLPEGFEGRLERTLRTIEERLPWIDRLMFETAVFRKRAIGVGVVPRAWVDEMAITGPTAQRHGYCARSSGRTTRTRSIRELDFEVITEEDSDMLRPRADPTP